MSFDGPCSVLRGGMLSFPFSSSATEALVSREHLQTQQPQQQSKRVHMPRQQKHYQHLPTAAAFAPGSIADVRQTVGERKENTEPLHATDTGAEHLASVITTSGIGGAPMSGSGWDPDELPPILQTPRLRSVSSLVLSSDGEAENLSLGEISPSGCPRSRGGSRESSGWSSRILDDLSTSLRALPPPPPLPLLTSSGLSGLSGDVAGGDGGNHQRLPREQSFPPGMQSAGTRRLSREPSFPPLDNGMAFVGTQPPDTSLVSAWRSMSMSRTAEGASGSGALGTESGGGGGGGSGGGGCQGDSGARARSARGQGCFTGEFHRFGGNDGVHDSQHDRALSADEWDVGDGIDGIEGDLVGTAGNTRRGSAASAGVSDAGDDLFSSSHVRSAQHSREPSFDELAAMIPGIPHHFQPANASRSAPGRSAARVEGNRRAVPATATELTAATILPKRERLAVQNKKMAPRSRGEHGVGGPKRRNSGKLEDAAGAAGPASINGGPVDPDKKVRREAAIKRYIHKRSRRKFANSTRDASPSRSRPKAAKIRPRRFGKFVKVVPDFIPVTAVVADGGGGHTDGKMGEALNWGAQSTGNGGGWGGVGRGKGDGQGVGLSVKREPRGSGGTAGRQQRSSIQHHQYRSGTRAQGDRSALIHGDFSSLWHTPPQM